MWLLLELIANTYNMIFENPGKDYLVVIAADKDTDDEKSLAVRPNGLRNPATRGRVHLWHEKGGIKGFREVETRDPSRGPLSL